MKQIYWGIQGMNSFKKADGAPFDMTQVFVGVPVEPGSFGKDPAKQTKICGFGLKPAEVDADMACVPEFEKVPSGALVEFKTEQRFFMGGFKTVITGVAKVFPPVGANPTPSPVLAK